LVSCQVKKPLDFNKTILYLVLETYTRLRFSLFLRSY